MRKVFGLFVFLEGIEKKLSTRGDSIRDLFILKRWVGHDSPI